MPPTAAFRLGAAVATCRMQDSPCASRIQCKPFLSAGGAGVAVGSGTSPAWDVSTHDTASRPCACTCRDEATRPSLPPHRPLHEEPAHSFYGVGPGQRSNSSNLSADAARARWPSHPALRGSRCPRGRLREQPSSARSCRAPRASGRRCQNRPTRASRPGRIFAPTGGSRRLG